MLHLGSCNFLSFYHQLVFKKYGAFIREGAFIANMSMYTTTK